MRARLKDYHEKTEPILQLFDRMGLVFHVDGTQTPEAVHEVIVAALSALASDAVP